MLLDDLHGLHWAAGVTVDGWLILVGFAGPTVASIGAAVASWQAARATTQVGSKVREVHLSLNSRLDELLLAARAEGRQQERDERHAK
jgi:hypothetical protein